LVGGQRGNKKQDPTFISSPPRGGVYQQMSPLGGGNNRGVKKSNNYIGIQKNYF